jgi:hypothetical protein
VACLRQIYQDNKALHVFLDGAKNSYVIDNTKLIEFEEKTYNLKNLIKDAARAASAGETFSLKLKNFKLSVCREILTLRLKRPTPAQRVSETREQMV